MSRSPLITDWQNVGVFAPVLFAPVGYYAALARHSHAAILTSTRYDKRFKSAHRYTIADAAGMLSLTVPHSSPGPERTWDCTPVSDHGRWWDVHRVAWESAYGRTPFFEFYIDRFLPLLRWPQTTVGDYIRRADEVVRDILGLTTEVSFRIPDGSPCINYCREDFSAVPPVPYYQVRAGSMGFIPGLSILDLIFNMGPESPLILQAMQPR